jgi:phage tail sheath gpL-like
MLVEGQFVAPESGGATVNVPVLVNSINDCDAMFGPGSVLCESLKKVFSECSSNIQVWALPRADAAEAIAATYTMTITGTATSPGVFSLFMLDGEYNIEFPVAIGATPTVIAAAIVAALPYNFPYTAVAAAGVITFTAINAGTCGNYLAPVYNYLGLQNYAPAGVSVACVSATVGSVDPTALNYATVLGSCCYSIYALLSGNSAWQLSLENWIRSAWACNIPAGFNNAVPQCFGHGYTFNAGSLGTVLSEGDNAEVFCRIAYPLNDPNAPYFLTAAFAARSACSACTSPELNVQGPVDGTLTSISRPTSCAEPWSYSARLTLQNAGFVTWGPVTNAASQLTNPYIYQDITNNLTDALDRPNATWQSTSTRRWAANFSNLLAQYLDGTFNGLSAYSNGTQIKPGIFGTTLNMMRAKIIAWLNANSGSLISAIQDVNAQVQLTASLDTSPPCRGIPGNYALTLVVQPPVRINNIATTLFPQLFTNCNNQQYSQAYQLANQ